MNAYAYVAIHDVTAICAGAYLASHDCPWWAAICFLLALNTTVEYGKKS